MHSIGKTEWEKKKERARMQEKQQAGTRNAPAVQFALQL